VSSVAKPVTRTALNPCIPEELLARPQWIAWWSVAGEGRHVRLPNGGFTKALKLQAKPHKLPIDPLTGGLAATTRPATWSSAEDANAAAQKWSLTGIGFVFNDSDPYGGVDLDNCRNPETGQIAEWAWDIIRELNSYTEISPSGTGIHTIVRGELPSGKGNQSAYRGGKVEMFSRARYFTFTGNLVESTPSDIHDRHTELLGLHDKLFNSRKLLDATVIPSPIPSVACDDELIAKAKSAHNGAKFERLWNGDWENDYPSQSGADSALCSHLAFWTGRDLSHMDALFRRSGLMRKKWLRNDYRERTLAKAIAITTKTWNSSQRKRVETRAAGRISVAPAVGHSSPAGSAPIWEPPIPFHQFELPRFPVESLSGWLRTFVEAEAMATQTPVDLPVMLALSVVAAACAKKVVVQIKPGYFEPVNIYAVTSLPQAAARQRFSLT
jgi:putative DNA primase/helicase